MTQATPTALTRRSLLKALAVLLGGALLLTACGSSDNTGGGMGNMPGMNHGAAATAMTSGRGGMPEMTGTMGTATVAAAVEYDQAFIDAMVPHHQAAVEMAKVAQRQAEHPELKQLANAIVADQEREIATMKSWRKIWYGSDTIPPGMGGHQMAGMDVDLSQLERARPFDKAFIDAMIPHHQSALEMAREAQVKATHPGIKQLAVDIIAAQQREIDQLKQWRAQWYPGQ